MRQMGRRMRAACGDWAESRNTVLDAGEVEQIVSIEFRPQGREDPVFVADDPRNDYKMLDRAALTEAMARIIHQPGLCRAEVRVSVLSAFVKADACNIDDEVCDVIIQIALFGEIVYC